jgi:transcriptional regulator with XRE-family HTH domain
MFEPLPALMRLKRQQLGLTLDAASALADVSRSRLAALEKGDDNISLDLLVKLANAYGMTEIRIGGLRVGAAASDFRMLVAAAEALQTAGKLVEQAEALGAELKRVAGPVAELLAPVLAAPADSGQPAEGAAGIETLARMLAQRRRKGRRLA